MNIQLEHGRYYVRRDGLIVGPVIKICDPVWDFWIPSDGFRPYLRSGKTDSPSGWIDSKADLVKLSPCPFCWTASYDCDYSFPHPIEPAPAQDEQQPVAWMHDERVDVIHADVKDLLERAGGHLSRPLDKTEHYTIPLYAAPIAQAEQHPFTVPDGYVLVPEEQIIESELDNLRSKVEALSGLLEELHPYVRGCSSELWDRYRATLSQQAEPAPINQCGGCQAGVPVDDAGYHRMGKPDASAGRSAA